MKARIPESTGRASGTRSKKQALTRHSRGHHRSSLRGFGFAGPFFAASSRRRMVSIAASSKLGGRTICTSASRSPAAPSFGLIPWPLIRSLTPLEVLGGILKCDRATRRRHVDFGTQNRLGQRDGQLHFEIVAMPLIKRVGATCTVKRMSPAGSPWLDSPCPRSRIFAPSAIPGGIFTLIVSVCPVERRTRNSTSPPALPFETALRPGPARRRQCYAHVGPAAARSSCRRRPMPCGIVRTDRRTRWTDRRRSAAEQIAQVNLFAAGALAASVAVLAAGGLPGRRIRKNSRSGRKSRLLASLRTSKACCTFWNFSFAFLSLGFRSG